MQDVPQKPLEQRVSRQQEQQVWQRAVPLVSRLGRQVLQEVLPQQASPVRLVFRETSSWFLIEPTRKV